MSKHDRQPRTDDRPSITCPVCDLTSYHPSDIEAGYCGYCHAWTGEPGGG